MTNSAHIVETGLLLLAAYLLGCVVGYVARRILYAARGTHPPVVVTAPTPVATAEPARPRQPARTPAARLAATASPEPAQHPDTGPVTSPKPATRPRRKPADPKPATLSAPRGNQADNLKQIKGIGPKIEASLNGLGIYHLDQIASWTKANVDWIDSQLAFKGRIQREQWVNQAAKLTKAEVSA